MDERAIEGLEARIGRLEGENRRLKRVGYLALPLVAVATIGGAKFFDNPDLQPGKIVVTDPGGSSCRIVLEATADGTVINMFDGVGTLRANLGTGKTGQALRFYDASGIPVGKSIP